MIDTRSALTIPRDPSVPPPTVARRVNREIVLLLGWGPAILLQFAHPMVAAGVAEHSSFRAAPVERLRRLRSTLDAMLALTFGTPEQVARAAAGINEIHDRVQGELGAAAGPFPAGAGYSAHDPELLRWVHATMLDLLPRTYRLFVGPLDDRDWDRYCLEASGVAPLLGLPTDYLPASLEQLQTYLRVMLEGDEVVVTPTARMLAQALLWPPFPSGSQALLRLVRLTAVGLLPPGVRRGYGFRWEPRQERALLRSAGAIRLLLGLTPGWLKHWPAARRAG